MALGRLSRTAGEVWPTAVAQGAKEAQEALAADLIPAVEARVVESRAVAALEAELAVVPVAVRVGKQQVQLEEHLHQLRVVLCEKRWTRRPVKLLARRLGMR